MVPWFHGARVAAAKSVWQTSEGRESGFVVYASPTTSANASV